MSFIEHTRYLRLEVDFVQMNSNFAHLAILESDYSSAQVVAALPSLARDSACFAMAIILPPYSPQGEFVKAHSSFRDHDSFTVGHPGANRNLCRSPDCLPDPGQWESLQAQSVVAQYSRFLNDLKYWLQVPQGQ